MRVFYLEGYHGGSHQAFAEGWARRSRHTFRMFTLPARKWKWRMQTAAWLFAREVLEDPGPAPDAIFATDMVNLAEFLGLTRGRFARVPAILYFHENQYSYPPQVEDKTEFEWGAINVASALAAHAIVFNSEFHRRDFFASWRHGNLVMPDGRLDPREIARLEQRARVIPVGVDFEFLDRHAPSDGRSDSPKGGNTAAKPRDGQNPIPNPPLILWNHRWEHDKRPEALFDTLRELKRRGCAFRLAVCGESFAYQPDCFETARREFADQIHAFGFLEKKEDYARLLWNADIVVSTAAQEFLGLSTIEALWCGCYPLLPNRLNYPHLLPAEQHPAHLYESDRDLVKRLEALLRGPETIAYPPRQEFLVVYRWESVAEQLDQLLEDSSDSAEG